MVGSFGAGWLVVLVGVVLTGVAPDVLSGVVGAAAGAGVASAALAGAGVEVAALGGWLEAVVEGASATTIGAVAALSCTGLSPEPSNTPNASSAITAMPLTSDEGIGSPGESSCCGSAPASPRWPGPAAGPTPISAASAGASGPHRAPHSTQ